MSKTHKIKYPKFNDTQAMGMFEVGKAYSGWCCNPWANPASLKVLEISSDRSTLKALTGGLNAERFTIVYDSRFGEKVVDRKGETLVWRADKVQGDAILPEGWYDGEKRRRAIGREKAATTRAHNKNLCFIHKNMTVMHFSRAFHAFLQSFQKNALDVAPDYFYQKIIKWNGTFECSRIMKTSAGRSYFKAKATYTYSCAPFKTSPDGLTRTTRTWCESVLIYADSICGCVKGEAFRAIFADILPA